MPPSQALSSSRSDTSIVLQERRSRAIRVEETNSGRHVGRADIGVALDSRVVFEIGNDQADELMLLIVGPVQL